MIRSRRSAARSLLLLRLAQACMRGGRLEMISVWLLFLRLLRATTGVRRPNENELTEGRRDSLNQQSKEQEDLSKAVAMETSQHQDLGETQGEECQRSKDAREWLDAYFSENLDTEKGNAPVETRHTSNDDGGANKQEDVMINETEGQNLQLKESVPSQEHGTDHQGQGQVNEENAISVSTFSAENTEDQTQHQAMEEENNQEESFDADKTGHQVHGQPVEDATNNSATISANATDHQEETNSNLCFDAVETDHPPIEQETNCRFSLDENETDNKGQGSMVDKEIDKHTEDHPVEQETNQSFSLQENEAGQQAQDLMVEEEIHSDIQNTDHQAHGQAVDEKPHNVASFDATEADHHERGQSVEQDTNHSSSVVHQEDSQLMENNAEQDQDQNVAAETQSTATVFFDAVKADHLQQDQQVDETKNPLSFYGPNETEHQDQDQTLEEQPNHRSSFDAKETEHQETALEQQIKELAISDASTESCQDNDRDDLSDCLHVEMAVVLSDSDNEEQWKTMFSPVVDEDEFGAILETDLINRDLATEDEVTSLSETKAEPNEDEDPSSVTGSNDNLEQTTECPTECDMEDISYDSIHYSSLSRIPEDEEMAAKHNLQRLSASTSELDKKLPQDYCVIQETQSEHVSTEHVDFKMARQQWKQMEEQSKGKGQTPGLKHDTCQGGHSFMYTPVRNLERSKRDLESDSPGQSLSDYQFTQFSPCSDDSGLDDASYRSHYDEPETPVEREIRETMEREECFKRERAMARPSSDEPLQNKPRPVSLFPARSDLDEKKRMYNTREDRCRTQRPCVAKTPTLSFSASPSSKASYHEMVANNVIILEPESHAASPRSRTNNLLSPVSPVTSRFHEWPSDRSNVIILETSNLIIRSASEFCLSSACQEPQESTFHNNPFFKLRSHSTQSLVDQEIREVRQRDEEFRRQRAQLYAREKYDTVLVSPSLLQSFSYDKTGGMPTKCKSSPSSPMRVRKMDRSTLSCDQKFPEASCTRVRRKSALVQRWEAAVFSNQQQHL